jgi:SAM-dependent methyltransferase
LPLTKGELSQKFDDVARDFARKEYANLDAMISHRLRICAGWGPPLHCGQTVLELGCGDGYLAEAFVRHGYRYRGVDLSPQMVAVSEARLNRVNPAAHPMCVVGDVETYVPPEPVHLIAAFMRTFFHYSRDPVALLTRLRPFVRRKILVDLNPRVDCSIEDGLNALKSAGFHNLKWRPVLVPQVRRVPSAVMEACALIETLPVLKEIPLRWKFTCVLMGEANGD